MCVKMEDMRLCLAVASSSAVRTPRFSIDEHSSILKYLCLYKLEGDIQAIVRSNMIASTIEHNTTPGSPLVSDAETNSIPLRSSNRPVQNRVLGV